MYHFDGTAWSAIPLNPSAYWSTAVAYAWAAPNDVWMVDGIDNVNHFNGHGWDVDFSFGLGNGALAGIGRARGPVSAMYAWGALMPEPAGSTIVSSVVLLRHP
jgi:hypothetical protein